MCEELEVETSVVDENGLPPAEGHGVDEQVVLVDERRGSTPPERRPTGRLAAYGRARSTPCGLPGYGSCCTIALPWSWSITAMPASAPSCAAKVNRPLDDVHWCPATLPGPPIVTFVKSNVAVSTIAICAGMLRS